MKENRIPFCPAEILLPREGVPLETWACVACDQYTSQPEYWEKTEELVGDNPSTLRLMLPECWLGESDQRIPVIHRAMADYLDQGILIPAEIIERAREGCRAFVILQPFGCIPNHVVGRGISRRLKEMFPDIQLLPLDYDPDVSFVNVENRLQMLIMNIRSAGAGAQ